MAINERALKQFTSATKEVFGDVVSEEQCLRVLAILETEGTELVPRGDMDKAKRIQGGQIEKCPHCGQLYDAGKWDFSQSDRCPYCLPRK